MAQSQKTLLPPQKVTIPNTLASIVEVFSVESEEAAKILLKQAAAAIYYERKDEIFLQGHP